MNPELVPAPRSLSKLLAGIVTLPAEFDCELQGLELDSRKVSPGALFMACKGYSSDGRLYVDDAIARGAGAVLAEASDQWQGVSLRQAVPVVAVENLPAQMAELAARFYARPGTKMQLIGITGTNGKTSCCQLLAQLLTAIGIRCGIIGTLGYGMSGHALQQEPGVPGTTPDAVSVQRQLAHLLAAGAQAVAMEVSSHGLQQHRVVVDDFSIALFTNLTRDHLDFHGSMAAYGAVKRQLFGGSNLQLAILNANDAYVFASKAALAPGVRCLGWGIDTPAADINAVAVRYHAYGQQLDIVTPWGSFVINSVLLGAFNTSNLLAVVALVLGACADLADFNPARICQQAGKLQPVVGRMQLVPCPRATVTVVVDYAHTPDALEKALQAMRQHCTGKLWCVFGCGGDRDRGKRPLMGAVSEQFADSLVLTDDNPRSESSTQILADIQAGLQFPELVKLLPGRADAIRYAIASAAPGDCIVIAGKGHEMYQEVAGSKLPFSDAHVASQALHAVFAQGAAND